MSLFKNLTSEGLEENQDRAGGGFTARETDVYAGTIKVAYAGQSQGGAQNVTIIGKMEDGNEYRETIYITDKTGKNFFLSKDAKNDDGSPKKVALPGFTVIDDLCQTSAGKVLADMTAEEKVVNIYDYDERKEMPKSVPVLVELIGQPFLVAIKKSTVNKTKKEGDEYVATAETRDENNIEKVFHPTLRVTVVEAKEAAKKNQEPEAKFIDVWLEKNKGKTHDKRTIKDGAGGQSGRPRAGGNAGPPQSGETTARKSLFGSKQAA